MIETPLGVTRANEIASAHETVSCLVLGTSDLSRDLQANHTPDRTPLLYRSVPLHCASSVVVVMVVVVVVVGGCFGVGLVAVIPFAPSWL